MKIKQAVYLTIVVLFLGSTIALCQAQKVDFGDVKTASFDRADELLNLEAIASDMPEQQKNKTTKSLPRNPAGKNKHNSDISIISERTEKHNSREFVKTLDPGKTSLLDYKHMSRFDSESAPENSINVVPAPSSLILTSIGISIIGWFKRRKVFKADSHVE